MNRSIEYLALRHTDRGTLPAEDVRSDSETERVTRAPRVIVCAACRHPVTSEDQRISINGNHEHHCMNPAGFQFHIGCFGDAPGCRAGGAPTTQFTWFSGFAWAHALCGGCGVHLGWRFVGETSGFFGLILNRLAIDQGH